MEKEESKETAGEQNTQADAGGPSCGCGGGTDVPGNKGGQWRDFCKGMAGPGKMDEMMKMCFQEGGKTGGKLCCEEICSSIMNTKTKEK
jgi:hypothetical protein